MAKLILNLHPDEELEGTQLRESLETAFNVQDGVRHQIVLNGMFVYEITGEYELVDDDEIRTRV